MPIGIAGDNMVSFGGLPAPDMDTIELRVISNIMQQVANLLSAPGIPAQDELNVLRSDQAFELGVPTPLPGNSR